jgi:tRNA threonylcarbamoyladenosine biosynthesis protein TsaE
MKLLFEKSVNSLSENENFIGDILPQLTPGKVLGLSGELGAGKTTFTKMLVKKMGSNESVTSPSYVLQHEYNSNWGIIEHWDLYRLKEIPIELSEPISKEKIRIVEWSDKFPELSKDLDFVLKIEVTGLEERIFRFYLNK